MTSSARLTFLATGAAWATRSLLSFADVQYTEPVNALDWTAVWLYTAAWLLTAPAAVLLASLAPGRTTTALAAVIALGALTTGVANALEDGFGIKAFGPVYLVGFMAAWLGLLALAAAFLRARQLRLGGLTILLFLGILLFPLGGGVVTMAALGALACAPQWFLPARPTGHPIIAGDAAVLPTP
jgi:hypothetical protein